MLRKITAIFIVALGVLVLVLGLCFQGADANGVSDYLLYAGSSGYGSEMGQIAMALSPITNAQKQTQQTTVKAARLITAAIGLGILSLGLARLADAYTVPEKPHPAAGEGPAPVGAEAGVPLIDNSLPEL